MPERSRTPLLMLTANIALWQHWQALRNHGWLPEHARSLGDWDIWKSQGQGWALLDAALPGLPAWPARTLGPRFDGMKVLVLSAHPDDEQGHHALQQGASGYAHANTPVDTLATILTTIEQGGIWTGRSLLQRLLREVGQRLPPPPDPATPAWATDLTPREQAVAERAALGQSNPDIAQALGITERTVRAHLSATFEKLQVSDRLMLALKVHGIKS